MTHILSAFADRSAAESAAAQLAHGGFPAERTHVVERPAPINEGSVMLDELATGGMVHSLLSLLDGLFGTVHSDRVAEGYEDAVAKRGVALVVDVDDERDAMRAQALLRDAGAINVSTVPSVDGAPSTPSSSSSSSGMPSPP
ncbi:MAG TPA: hypothetical protein VMU47_17325 [Caldimonas sp.]|nr:hypothetical protein [Caldimonas sp.]